MTKSGPSPRGRRLLYLALPALIAGGALLLVRIERRPGDLCIQWEQAAQTATGDELLAVVAKLDAYGRYGLPALVRMLDAERYEVEAAARDVLIARLQRINDRDSAADRAVAAAVAADLATLVASRSGSTRTAGTVSQSAVDVALELFEVAGRLSADTPVGEPDIDAIVAVCDDVLRRAPNRRRPPLEVIVRAPPTDVGDAGASNAAANPLPIEPPGFVEVDAPSAINVAPPDLLPATAAADPLPLPQSQSPARLPSSPDVEHSTIAANTAARINPIRDAADGSSVLPASADHAATTSLPNDSISRSTAWELFAALQDGNRDEIERELRRRGFSPREIELGGHLCSADSAERLRYARVLPSLAGLDVKPWLLHLSNDSDADVRLTAASIMATTNDPELLARLRSMAYDDGDERIRSTAGRAADRGTLRR